MTEYYYECDFEIKALKDYTDWVNRVLDSENAELGNISFVFCEDDYLLDINQKFLNHDTYTDIITFDYSENSSISGDIFISIERVRENAKQFAQSFEDELLRVMAHGLLHLLGYKDKTEKEIKEIRDKEEDKMKMFHVEQK
jgi:rRNA maturation RNase YbeY